MSLFSSKNVTASKSNVLICTNRKINVVFVPCDSVSYFKEPLI